MTSSNPKPFRILSLDGGGIRGVYVAAFLAELERVLGVRLCDHFDLIAGTSTGGIIAAGIAAGEPASRIEQMYLERGDKIFTRRPSFAKTWVQRSVVGLVNRFLRRFGVSVDDIVQSKYEGDELRGALTEVFGKRKIGDLRTRVVIPAVDLTRGQPVVFKTPHAPNMTRDRHFSIVDVLMATTAAPTYFPHAAIGEGAAFVDGGLWANNPSMIAIVEAMRIKEKANREGVDFGIAQEETWLLSVGTGKSPMLTTPPARGGGLGGWMPMLFDVSSSAQSVGIECQSAYLLEDRCMRINSVLPNGRCRLDALEMVKELAVIGRGECHANIGRLKDAFFGSQKHHPYEPFPLEQCVVPAARAG